MVEKKHFQYVYHLQILAIEKSFDHIIIFVRTTKRFLKETVPLFLHVAVCVLYFTANYLIKSRNPFRLIACPLFKVIFLIFPYLL